MTHLFLTSTSQFVQTAAMSTKAFMIVRFFAQMLSFAVSPLSCSHKPSGPVSVSSSFFTFVQ